MDDQYAGWFKQYVAENVLGAAPVLTAVTKPVVLPVASPQAPIETKPVDRDAEFRKRHDDELDAIVEMQMRPDLFDDTPGGWQNVQKVLDWIASQGLRPSRAAVADAIRALKGELLTLFKPEPSPVPAKPIVREQRTQIDPITQPVVEKTASQSLPELSPWVWKQLGSNKMLTRQDVKSIPSHLYSELYRNNKYGPEFQKRVNALLNLR